MGFRTSWIAIEEGDLDATALLGLRRSGIVENFEEEGLHVLRRWHPTWTIWPLEVP
jgi:hypothetical protein